MGVYDARAAALPAGVQSRCAGLQVARPQCRLQQPAVQVVPPAARHVQAAYALARPGAKPSSSAYQELPWIQGGLLGWSGISWCHWRRCRSALAHRCEVEKFRLHCLACLILWESSYVCKLWIATLCLISPLKISNKRPHNPYSACGRWWLSCRTAAINPKGHLCMQHV